MEGCTRRLCGAPGSLEGTKTCRWREGWGERSEAALIRPLGYPIDEVRELRFPSNIWILPTPKSEIPGLASGKDRPEAGVMVLCIMDTSRNH